MQYVPVPILCARESLASSTSQNLLQIKGFASKEKPSCTDMWLEQISTAGLSTEVFVQVSFAPLLERDILIL